MSKGTGLGLAGLSVVSNVHMMVREAKSPFSSSPAPLVPDSGHGAPEGTDSVLPGFHPIPRAPGRQRGAMLRASSLPL